MEYGFRVRDGTRRRNGAQKRKKEKEKEERKKQIIKIIFSGNHNTNHKRAKGRKWRRGERGFGGSIARDSEWWRQSSPLLSSSVLSLLHLSSLQTNGLFWHSVVAIQLPVPTSLFALLIPKRVLPLTPSIPGFPLSLWPLELFLLYFCSWWSKLLLWLWRFENSVGQEVRNAIHVSFWTVNEWI